MKKFGLSGAFTVFLGAVCWSLNAPLVKFISLDALFVCGVRSFIAGVVLLPLAHLRQFRFSRWVVIYSVAYAILCSSFVVSMRMVDSVISIGMQYTSVVFLTLIAVFLGERISFRGWIPVVLIMMGVVLFMSTGFGNGGGNFTGNLIALSEGVSFTVMTFASKKAGKGNPIGLTCVANLFTGVLVLSVFFCINRAMPVLGLIDVSVLLVLGTVQLGAGYALYNSGLQRTTPQKASVMALWEMILGPLWVAIFLHEYPSIVVLMGFVVVLAGIFLDAIWTRS